MVNKVTLVGNLGCDVELHVFENGGKAARCTMATSETWKDKQSGEKKTETTWHNLVFHNQLAELADKYLKKGSKIYVEGRINNRSYESDGETKYITEIYVRDLKFLSTEKKESSADDRVPF